MSSSNRTISDSDSQTTTPHPELIELFTRNQRRLYLYILSQVPHPVDAEEILQETNLVIWRKFDEFRLGSNFVAWACRIASYEVLKYRDRRRRDRLCFSDQFVQHVAAEAQTTGEQFEERRRALMHCLGKLRKTDRELIERRYSPGENGKSVARALGRPVNSVYQSLGRIRRRLLKCIRHRLAAEAGS